MSLAWAPGWLLDDFSEACLDRQLPGWIAAVVEVEEVQSSMVQRSTSSMVTRGRAGGQGS